jgi:hypothetical protein
VLSRRFCHFSSMSMSRSHILAFIGQPFEETWRAFDRNMEPTSFAGRSGERVRPSHTFHTRSRSSYGERNSDPDLSRHMSMTRDNVSNVIKQELSANLAPFLGEIEAKVLSVLETQPQPSSVSCLLDRRDRRLLIWRDQACNHRQVNTGPRQESWARPRPRK